MSPETTKSVRTAHPSHYSRLYSPHCLATWLFATVILGFGGCGLPDTPVRLTFEMRSNQAADPSLRFYVSDLSMIDAEGHVAPVRLDPTPWQDGVTAMVALGGRTENAVVAGQVEPGHHVAVEFLLGVPFEDNHGNPLAAASPLNVPSMFWTWQSGYKFIRLDIANAWSFHLGSTGCFSASAVRPPTEPCREPNAARVRLAGEAPEQGTIVVDLDALLANVDTTTEENCMESYADRDACRGLLANLGMDPDTGRCLDGCRSQSVFRFAP